MMVEPQGKVKKYGVAVALGLLLAGAAIWGFVNGNEAGQSAQRESQTEQKISYKGEDGRNALELLKEKHEVKTQSFEGLGEFVTSIDGVQPDDSHYWALYVNGQMSQVGAGQYVTASSDAVEWRLEKIQ